jgi:Calx-beta domain-containing protein
VVRRGTASVPFTVPYTTTPRTAVPGRDFTPVSGVLIFPPNMMSQTFSVPVLDNQLFIGDQTVGLSLGAPDGAVLGPQSEAALTIREADQPGVILLAATTYTVAEDARSVVVTIMRTGTRLAGNVSVAFATANGTGPGAAVAGVNYRAAGRTVTFSAGETMICLAVGIYSDGQVTGPLRFTFTVRDPSGGATLASGRTTATITIQDVDRAGTVQFDAAAYRVNRSAGTATIRVTRRNGLGGGVAVNFQTVDGTARADRDYVRTAGVLTFGTNQSVGYINVPFVAQEGPTGDRAFGVVLSAANPRTVVGSPARTTVTMADDQPAKPLAGLAVPSVPGRAHDMGARSAVQLARLDVLGEFLAQRVLRFIPI